MIKSSNGELTAPLIIEALRKNGHVVTKLSLTKPTLNEVYLQYTGKSMRDAEESRRIRNATKNGYEEGKTDERSEDKVSKNRFHGLWALTNRDLKKWYQNPIVFIIGIIQPILWLALLGKAMNIGAMFSSTSIPQLPRSWLQALLHSNFKA